MTKMPLELDHCFILTEPGAVLAERVSATGLHEGPPSEHPGQGTANRRFFCANFMLELLYLQDADEADCEPAARLRFVERLREPDASPFGLVLRSESEIEAFPGWRYRPGFFPSTHGFLVGANSDSLAEPLCICMPPEMPRAQAVLIAQNRDWHLTGLCLGVPVTQASAPLRVVSGCDPVTLQLDAPHRLELEFNDARAGRQLDLTAELALLVRW